MSLSIQSINEAAKKRARRARINVEHAEIKLKAANETLEAAIPQGDTAQIQVAHVETKLAEEAVVRASEDLEVVETLLGEECVEAKAPHPSSGEGLKSLVKLLQNINAT